ncbi:ectonucleoside triphosphate diphosphohydrolase 1-like isoform X1 [Macrobrachium rosenbergii]|uniref:ectonucleoside triphosphate diphosphohydrolase 1-like isoform X1 n=1 Tax=Macrobrachium rosenbergii TaxID=79674 RepID=UPI0034D6F149
MKVTVWSSLSGKLSGHLTMNVPATHTIRRLLESYCKHKGVTSSGYVIRSKDNLLLNPNKSLEECSIDDGDILTLGLGDDEEQTFGFGSWFMVTVVSLLIGGIGLTYTIWTFLEPLPSVQKYGIVMDAGSSHSEIYVFSWDGQKHRDTGDVTLDHRCFMAGGVGSFVENVDDLSRYLEKCLKETKENVPQPFHKDTPFYVEATAGMRILRDFDPEGANLVLATIREILKTMTSFQIIHNNIEIIEGSEEGASGWTAVNYLSGHLTKDKEPTSAALDVGGASVQITQEVIGNGTWTPENLTLYRHNYTVLSQSFLCYGIGEAEHRYGYFLVNDNGTLKNEIFIDPCLAEGVTHNITADELNGPCTRTDDSKPVLMGVNQLKWHKLKKIFKNYKASEAEHDSDMTEYVDSVTSEMNSNSDPKISDIIVTKGSSNPPLCNDRMKRLFDLNLCKETFTYGDCFNSKSLPPVSGDLVAFSGLFEQLMKALGLKAGTSLKEFETAVFEVCSLNADDLYKRFPDVDKALVEDLCFDAMYIYNLMTAGLGIDSSEWKLIQFTDEINNTAVDWTMGFMINRTTAFPAVIPVKPLSPPVFSLLLILFGSFLISGILFCWHSYKIKYHSTSYQRVIADHIDQELHRFI